MLTARLMGVAATVLLFGGCCSSDRCLDRASTQDRDRVTAPRIKLDVVYNDTVNSDKGDRTDWKYVMLARKGTLSVLLHWDNGKAKLELDVFDVMGMKIQEGRVWGAGGLRALVAVEDPGPYYIRIRAAGKSDDSQYAVRVVFEPKGGMVCINQNCKPLDRKCLEAGQGESSAIILCEQIEPGCNRWNRIQPCPPGILCRNGICDACANPCQDKAQRCTDGTHFQICGVQPGSSCPVWGKAQSCPPKHHCKEDQCVKVARGSRCPATCPAGTTCNRALGQCVKVSTPVPVAAAATKCHIISIYKYRGNWTLHLECPENAAVKAGQVGAVLEGQTDKALAGGEIKILRTSGRFAIATTALQQLGMNRWVRISLR